MSDFSAIPAEVRERMIGEKDDRAAIVPFLFASLEDRRITVEKHPTWEQGEHFIYGLVWMVVKDYGLDHPTDTASNELADHLLTWIEEYRANRNGIAARTEQHADWTVRQCIAGFYDKRGRDD